MNWCVLQRLFFIIENWHPNKPKLVTKTTVVIPCLVNGVELCWINEEKRTAPHEVLSQSLDWLFSCIYFFAIFFSLIIIYVYIDSKLLLPWHKDLFHDRKESKHTHCLIKEGKKIVKFETHFRNDRSWQTKPGDSGFFVCSLNERRLPKLINQLCAIPCGEIDGVLCADSFGAKHWNLFNIESPAVFFVFQF